MPDIEEVNVGGRMRHHGEALASNFIVHMFKSRHRQNLPIMDEFEKQAHFATDANVSTRMLKLVKELNWFHAYFKTLTDCVSLRQLKNCIRFWVSFWNFFFVSH